MSCCLICDVACVDVCLCCIHSQSKRVVSLGIGFQLELMSVSKLSLLFDLLLMSVFVCVAFITLAKCMRCEFGDLF